MWTPLSRSIHIGMVAWLLWPFLGRAQADVDSLDVWVRRMHPAPFMRCMPSDWESKLDALKVGWEDMTHMEHVREVNALLQNLQDSHAAVSAWDWMWGVEREHGSVPIRWAVEVHGLWVADSAIDGLPAGTRVLSLNGMEASECAAVVRDLGNVEGVSPVGQVRTGVHSLTPWIMGQTQSDTLHVQWLDRTSGAVKLVAIPGVPVRKAGRAWRPISQKGPAVQWTFPEEENPLGLDGASLLAVSSFSQGRFGKYQRRLWKGFQRAKELGLPVVIDLRGNAGGQSARMEMLWRHVANGRRKLPFGLVAKQSPETRRDIHRHYKRLRKGGSTSTRTPLKMRGTSTTSPIFQWGSWTRLNSVSNRLWIGASRVPFACSWMVNRPRQPCRLRGHSNKGAADLCLGSRAWGPNKGPWATPWSRCCLNPES